MRENCGLEAQRKISEVFYFANAQLSVSMPRCEISRARLRFVDESDAL